jgi:hypothetical protein
VSAPARAVVSAPVKPTVVLACSTADAVALPRVLKRLVDVGVRVDVCAGVELDARPLQRALARGTARTSYVICCSRELDGEQLDRLYRMVRDAGVAADRAAVLRFESQRPDELTGALLQRLADHGVVAVPGAPAMLSSEDVTEPVMIIPRELERPVASPSCERSDAVLPVALQQPPSRPRRAWLPLAIAASMVLALVSLAAVRWAARVGQEASVATAGIAVPRSSSAAAVLASGGQGLPDHVRAALELGTIRASDGLLVAEPGEVSMHRPVARRRCKELFVAGISEWRMPTRAELDKLAAGGLLELGTTWWHAGEEREKPRARWTGVAIESVPLSPRAAARTVCVHDPLR